jgi:hypothetical protein
MVRWTRLADGTAVNYDPVIFRNRVEHRGVQLTRIVARHGHSNLSSARHRNIRHGQRGPRRAVIEYERRLRSRRAAAAGTRGSPKNHHEWRSGITVETVTDQQPGAFAYGSVFVSLTTRADKVSAFGPGSSSCRRT